MFALSSSREGAPNSPITVPLDGTDGDQLDAQGNPIQGPGMGGQGRITNVTIDPGDSNQGTITLTGTPVGAAGPLAIYEQDQLPTLVQVVFDLTDPNDRTRSIDGFSLTNVIGTSAGMNGSENWKLTAHSGD